jgi:hypothetical protein
MHTPFILQTKFLCVLINYNKDLLRRHVKCFKYYAMYIFVCLWLIPHPVVLWQNYGSMECAYVAIISGVVTKVPALQMISSIKVVSGSVLWYTVVAYCNKTKKWNSLTKMLDKWKQNFFFLLKLMNVMHFDLNMIVRVSSFMEWSNRSGEKVLVLSCCHILPRILA